jgi:hypothetical protein
MQEYNRLRHWSEDDLRRSLDLKERQLKASRIEDQKIRQDIDDILKEQWRRRSENATKNPD